MRDNFGYRSAVDEFEMFEEGDSSNTTWLRRDIDSNLARNLVSDSNMSWETGYPSKSLCDRQKEEEIKIDLEATTRM